MSEAGKGVVGAAALPPHGARPQPAALRAPQIRPRLVAKNIFEVAGKREREKERLQTAEGKKNAD